MRLTAVLLVDVTADPSSPHAISEAAAAVSHPYCMRGALLNGLSSRPGSAYSPLLYSFRQSTD